MRIGSRRIGFAVMAGLLPFPSARPPIPIRRSPENFYVFGLILPARSSSSELLRDKPSRARPLELTRMTCLGFCPLRDITRARPLTAGRPISPLRSVLGLSQPLDGLLRAPACRLISSCYRVQDFSRSGCSPLAQPPFLIGRSLPPCRHSSRANRPKSAATPDALGFEASIRARMRSPG
jgi:hypothetical protein